MRALVLSGGGSKGAYEVGVLQKWMAEDGLDYDLISGVSVGALNAATLCQAPKGSPVEAWEYLRRLWLDVTTARVRKSWWPLGIASALWKPSVYDSRPLHEWVRGSLRAEKIHASGRMLRVLAVSWDSGETRVVDETNSEILEWVLASSAFPGMFLPIDLDNQLWADGALRSVTPLGEAVRAGATEIDMILCTDPRLPDPYQSQGRNVLELALRAVDLLINEILRDDLKLCVLKNGHPHFRKIALRIVKPKMNLNRMVGGGLNFSPPAMRELMQFGYSDACAGPAAAEVLTTE